MQKYYDDGEFLLYFDQRHMFIHFMGVKEEPWPEKYQKVLTDMINTLQDIEDFISRSKENLLTKFQPQERSRIGSAELSQELSKHVRQSQ